MTYFDSVCDLSFDVDGLSFERRERDTSSDFTRVTTVFVLSGAGAVGRGEDVTYDTEDHDALPEPAAFDLSGSYTFGEFSEYLDGVDLFPTKDPERETGRHYRRWAAESAALDLALRQNGESLSSALGVDPSPLHFVTSTRLGDPPTTDRLRALRERVPDVEFKLDPTPDWGADVVSDLQELGGVRILDFKALYEGTDVDTEPDPDLYRRLLEAFPDAVVEDPALTPETRPLVEDASDRVSWDYPITGVESVEELPFEPQWLNIKPSRFGTVESLFETIAYCEERDVELYGGGQFELGVGRDQIQLLASLFYPEGPNDVAPGVYNEPEVPESLPASPLAPPANDVGF